MNGVGRNLNLIIFSSWMTSNSLEKVKSLWSKEMWSGYSEEKETC